MDFMTSVKTCFNKYANFKGRARRAELWWFFLFITIVSLVLTAIDMLVLSGTASEIGLLSTIFSFAILIPSFAVGARRLHDINKSGWWQILGLIPLLGWAIMIYWFATEGNAGDNDFGADPLS